MGGTALNALRLGLLPIPYLIEQGMPVKAYVTDAFWLDIGSLEKYEKLDHDDVERRFAFLFKGEDRIEIY